MSITSVHLSPEIEEGLEAISGKLQRSKNWLINQALREYIAREQEETARWLATLGAMESLARGKVVAGEDVHRWMSSWGTAAELPAPKRSA